MATTSDAPASSTITTAANDAEVERDQGNSNGDAAGKEAEEGEELVGPVPLPVRPRQKRPVQFELAFLDAFPSAAMYEKSYMHRDVVTHVAVSPADFFITGSADVFSTVVGTESEAGQVAEQARKLGVSARARLGFWPDWSVAAWCASDAVAPDSIAAKLSPPRQLSSPARHDALVAVSCRRPPVSGHYEPSTAVPSERYPSGRRPRVNKRQLFAASSPLLGGVSAQHRSTVCRPPPMAHKGPDTPGGSGGGRTVQLKDLVPAATNTVNTTFIMLDKAARAVAPHGHGDAREETWLALVADETAAVHFLLWGAEWDAFEPGDIVRLTDGIFSYHKGNSLALRAGRRGRMEKVGEFTMLFVETPNMSEVKWARDPGDPKRMVQEAVVSPHSHVFKPLQ